MINGVNESMTNPLVSVILPVYNCDNYIVESLDSVVRQTYVNLEIIIIDDCSSDLTNVILGHYAEIDSRIKVFRNDENMGVILSRNRALEVATGKFVAFIDADDVWHLQKLEIQVGKMLQFGSVMSFTSYRHMSSNGQKIGLLISGPPFIGWYLHHATRFIALSSVVVDLGVIPKDKFDKNNKFGFGEDFLLWGKIMVNTGKAMRIKFDLLHYRLHEESLSSNKLKSARNIWFIQRQIEKLSILQTTGFFILYTFFSVFKRIAFAPYFDKGLFPFKSYL